VVGFPLPPLSLKVRKFRFLHLKELITLKNILKGNQNNTKIIQHLKGQSIVMKYSLRKQKLSSLVLEDGARLIN
jgi:hypothetical protein